MKDFRKLQKICLEELEKAGIKSGNIIEWQINKRAIRRWGMCKKNPDNTYIIQVSSRLLDNDNVSEKACKETIIHEILHTCEGCHGHTGVWLNYANIMNSMYGYNIKRTTSSAEKGIIETIPVNIRPYKYIYACKKCGQTIGKTRACKFTKYFKNYSCGICGKRRAFYRIK